MSPVGSAWRTYRAVDRGWCVETYMWGRVCVQVYGCGGCVLRMMDGWMDGCWVDVLKSALCNDFGLAQSLGRVSD
eukprot:206524-Chlamydomonas_euryale.AAC.4